MLDSAGSTLVEWGRQQQQHLENALTASDCLILILILIDKKIKEEIFELDEKESKKNNVIKISLMKAIKE